MAEVLENPQEMLSKIPTPNLPESSTLLYDHWDKAAKRLMKSLWRCNSANIFHHPVDPERLGIPDYFEIVKDPIDFGTIK